MVRFIPEVRPEEIAVNSERVVYEALRALPSGYIVLHSFPWLRPNRDISGEPLREGEADFVVLHPHKGILILEVKGGHIELKDRKWIRSGQELRDPFDQARRSRYAILEAIEERTKHTIHRGLLTHGDMVVFPHVRLEGPLPLNSDPRILVDATGLNSLPAQIDAAFAAWTRRPSNLNPVQFTALLNAIMPKLRLIRCAGAEIHAEHCRIVQLTLDQRATLLGLLESNRVLVEGTAGSGKTLLALEFALTLADRGERVLLLCFNRNLATWLQEQARSDSRGQHMGQRLEISTFHACAHTVAKRANVEFEVPKVEGQEFWDNEVPLIMEQSLEVLRSKGQAYVFDAVVVDEAQDFAPDWWVTIDSLTQTGSASRLYAFFDLNQSLRGATRIPPVTNSLQFRLATNCRNTKAIAQSAAVLANVEIRLLPGSPIGDVPAVRRAASPNAEAGLALAEIRQLLRSQIQPNQIALIGPAAQANGSLANHREVDGVPLINDASDWRRGGGVLVTTAKSFKGLEADIVVVYGLAGFGGLFSVTDLYVAWTRARHRLILICQQGDVRALAESALAHSEDLLAAHHSTI